MSRIFEKTDTPRRAVASTFASAVRHDPRENGICNKLTGAWLSIPGILNFPRTEEVEALIAERVDKLNKVYRPHAIQVGQEMIALLDQARSVQDLRRLTAAKICAAGAVRNHFLEMKGELPLDLDLPTLRSCLEWQVAQLRKEE
jgi:hypothetical protein